MNIQIDTLAYSNRLRNLPPSQKLGFALAALLLALVSHYPVQLLLFVWVSIWIVVYAGIPRQIYISMILGVLTFLLTSLPALVIEYAKIDAPTTLPDRLGQLVIWGGQLYLSRSGLIQALQILLRSLACTSALFLIVLTIPAIELATMGKKMGCPPILIELSLLVYRFIFLLADTAQKILTAQVARGGYRTRRIAMNSVSLLVRQLIQRTANRYQQMTLGVAARGFQQEFRFWQPASHQYSWRYGGEAIGGCGLLIVGEILYRIYV